MREAVIVSYARTGLAKSVRGGFNITHGAALTGHALQHAIARAGVDPAEVEDEIGPMTTKMKTVDKATGQESVVDYVVERDECNRPETTLEALSGLQPVRGPGNTVTAGNASQLSDGAAAVMLMEAKAAERK